VTLTAAAALALTSMPQVSAKPLGVAQSSADDLGVMSINLKDVVKPQVGVQGQTQAAGTPNQAGIGGFLPLAVGKNIATSSRLGYRWLNGNRSWMYGINAGYDTRPMSTGPADTGIPVYASRTAFFQQAAVNVEAVHDIWAFNAYALIPTAETTQTLNTVYQGGALDTYGLDASYNINSALRASIGYYYQNGDLSTADGSGVEARLTLNLKKDLTIGANLSYDNAFKSRFSADVKWRFATNSHKDKPQPRANHVVNALTATPIKRNVRIHDGALNDEACIDNNIAAQQAGVNGYIGAPCPG
jgi:hypothetical protein